MGTRPVPSVFNGNRPCGGGGRSEDGGRVKFGGGKRPNGDDKLIFEFVGGNGSGQVEFVVVVVIAGVVLVVVTVVVEVLSF
jgi:hypothetical protein